MYRSFALDVSQYIRDGGVDNLAMKFGARQEDANQEAST